MHSSDPSPDRIIISSMSSTSHENFRKAEHARRINPAVFLGIHSNRRNELFFECHERFIERF